MPAAIDPSPTLRDYAHPERLVTTEWLNANIGSPRLTIIECDEDPLLYDIGHIPGAVKLNWRLDLVDQVMRDVVDGAHFSASLRAMGVERDDTVVFYGDQNNRRAGYAAWIFALFGHDDARLLMGGRAAWMNEDRETTLEIPFPRPESDYPEAERDDATARIFKEELTAALGGCQVIDVRTAAEFAGDDGPTTIKGHIPTARHVAWAGFFRPDGSFRSASELRELLGDVDPAEEVVVYSHAGQRAAHVRFALTHLLGYPRVRVYDGSWLEWGNSMRTPVERDVTDN